VKTRTIVILAIVALIVILGSCTYNGYNNLVKTDQEVKNSWGNVEASYQRRTDLYNSVIKVVQGSANFEKSTLTSVIEARSKATSVTVDINDPQTLEKYQQAQNQLQGAFGKLLAIAEAYPDIKTTQEFKDFQTQIEGTENRINIARRDFNKAVNDYNLKVRTFPNNIIAGLFGFKEKPYYKANPGSENPPNINFDIK
jgi:LemA protein